jgi:tol-pal system protein YbgF
MPREISSQVVQTKPMTKDLMRKRIGLVLLVGLVLFAAAPAYAVNKDLVQMQSQIQDLQSAVARLQQSNDERMGVLRDLVQQNVDTVNKMSVVLSGLQQQLRTQQDTTNGKIDQVGGQVQSLSDSLDEVKVRLNNLEKAMQSVQNQQQSIDAALQNLAPPATGAAPTPAAAGPTPTDVPSTLPPLPSSLAPPAPVRGAPSSVGQPGSASAVAAPTLASLYKTALSDWMGAQYATATTEFNEIIRSYPSDPLAGNSYYYLGEIDYSSGKYTSAIKNYDHVLDQFPDNPKVPVSHWHKAKALLEIGKRDAAIAEMRTLIARFPHSPEAAQAHSKLSGMGVSAVAKRAAQ